MGFNGRIILGLTVGGIANALMPARSKTAS